MKMNKYLRLVNRGILTRRELAHIMGVARDQGGTLDELLSARCVPKHELLFCLSEYYGAPYVEFDEGVIVSQRITRSMDLERLKRALWLPLSIMENTAEVIACYPDDPALLDDIQKTLGKKSLTFHVALPSDLVRIIEHNQDLNPGFPPDAGRTPLAKVRTFLADRRSLLSCYRTALAKGRTGLAFLRTGISFITIALVLFRIFGLGYLIIVEALLFFTGLVMAIDGIRWYMPARRTGKKTTICSGTEHTGGTAVLTASNPGDAAVFTRSAPTAGADGLRSGWNRLSPVMRRRFLASDRTDFAEERTVLACYRTLMARARTGLAFTRTGFAFIGLGIALFRQFSAGPWTIVDAVLVLAGLLMVAEGFSWYLPGRRAASESDSSVRHAANEPGIWDMVFPPQLKDQTRQNGASSVPPVRGFDSPGIWATTGLALERTLLADRRNVMARLRTVMARSRTGMAFIRTGMALSAVGLGLLAYFGAGSIPWALFDAFMIVSGLLFIADGLYWYLPAERTRQQYPYCYGELEITLPDYGIPTKSWRKAVFSQDDL